MHAFGFKVRGAAKRMPKYAPEAFQNQARPAPKPSKIEARGIPGRKNAFKKRPKPAKKRPRAPNNCPRGTQEASKRGQEPPQTSQKPASKSDPREVRSPPKPSPTSPKTRMEQDFCGKLCSTRSGSDFISFFHLRDKLAICKSLRKPKKNYGFYASGAMSD